MADTTYTFSRTKISAPGFETMRTHTRIRTRFSNGIEVVHDSTGWPRGELEGDYEATSEIELTSQEALDGLVQLAISAEQDPLTVTQTWAPRHGKSRSITVFVRLQDGEIVDERARESMLTLTFVHVDVMHVDGKPIREDIRAA